MCFILDFENLVHEIQEFEGVSRKSSIDNVINLLSESYNVSGDVVIDIGDDASAVDIGNNQVILVAADGIWGQIMNVNPYWAGYCSVLVNVNDIAAMGGKPLAMVNIMSINNDEIYEELLTGIKDGCLKFGVPMVGGHLHPDADCDSLGVAIVGIAQKDKLITSFGAEVGDKIIVAIDLDGKPHEMFSLNWDTTYDKDAQLVQDQITAVQYLAEHDYIKSGKDISNPGILGTLEMLLETSGKGAEVNLLDIPINENMPWNDWLKSYPGSGFVFTASDDKCEFIKEYLAKYSIESNVVGEVTNTNSLYLTYEDKRVEVFNQEKNPVFKL
ncbi:MAG: methanogenesis marker 2 protein [Methanobrevibacter sp.]|nr:methanogenesis marker 2 protein [Methanobrevibacter sp.]